MDNLVKQRLVGALILTALAVVFWPIIFVSDTARDDALRVTVPPAPPVDMTPLAEPDNVGMRQSGPAAAQTQRVPDVDWPADANDPTRAASVGTLPQKDAVVPVPSLEEARETLNEPELDEEGLPIAYALQVATMSDQQRAKELRDELVGADFKGYLKRLRRGDQVLFRVLVGPKFNRDELLPIKAIVDETFEVESIIIRYLP